MVNVGDECLTGRTGADNRYGPVTVVGNPLTACLTVIQSPLFPAGTLIVPKSRVLPLMLRVMEAVVVPDTEAT
jgi:hypothetical protein